ncbi:MAG: dUTP diphosphatase [Pyrinomonadaceae bacterium]|nr:dUTP diphosphatase [Phycisphaerales bacterium]
MERPLLRVKMLSQHAVLPAYQSDGAAGLDLAACLHDVPGKTMTIAPGDIVIVPTGIAAAIPLGFEGQVRARSGLASKHGITLPNSPGTIDSDYRGEIKVPLINLGRKSFTLEHGQRIAQMVISAGAHVRVEPCEELDSTQRGEGGFGSTG